LGIRKRTLHIWAQNAGIYDPLRASEAYPKTLSWVKNLVDHHIELQHQLGKPLVLEEFGLAREENSYDPHSKTTHRDDYFSQIFQRVYESASLDSSISGVNFWAWGGEAAPPAPLGASWKPGDPFMGDPAHEHQGWYSIFSKDRSTLEIISSYARKLAALP
jgi:mannan endo-1,4-beta-mannosidase